MATGFEDLGFVPKKAPIDSNFSDLGFVPRQKQEQMPTQEEPSNGFMHYASMLGGPNPMSIIRLLRSAAQGGVEAGRSIANLPHVFGAEGWKTPEPANFGPENPNLLEEGVRIIAPSAALATATGGGSLLGMMRGGAISGGVLDEENPLFGAAVGAGAGALGKAAPRIIDFAKNIYPQKVANEFATKYGAKGLEEIEAPSKAMWNKAFSSPKENIYEVINPTTRLTTPAHAKYINKLGNESRFEDLKNIFVENPNLENTHKLQSEIGSEIGDIRKRITRKEATQSDWLRFKELSKIRKDLLSDIDNYLEKTNPKLREAYSEASRLHSTEVIPARNAANIASEHISEIDNSVDKQTLLNALKNATTKKAFKRNPLPQEALTLTKQLEKNLANSKKVFNPWNFVYGAGAVGVPYGASHLLRHLLPNR